MNALSLLAMKQASRGFKKALHQPVISLFNYNGCGFFDGGCLLLADALVSWSGGEIKLAAIARSRFSGQVDHWMGELNVAGERLFLDANGLQTEAGLLSYWEREELREPVDLMPNPVFDEASEIPRDGHFSQRIAGEIEQALGTFATWKSKVIRAFEPDYDFNK